MIAAAYPCPNPRCDGTVMATAPPGYGKTHVCRECGWKRAK